MAPTRCLNPELFGQAASLPQRYQSSCMHAPVQTYLVTPLNGSSTLRSAGNFQSTTGPQKVNPLHASTLIAYAEAHLAITIAYAEATWPSTSGSHMGTHAVSSSRILIQFIASAH